MNADRTDEGTTTNEPLSDAEARRERMRELGRASGAARRARKEARMDRSKDAGDLRGWHEHFLALADSRPGELARRLFEARNTVTTMRALELATEAAGLRVREREKAVEARESEVEARERGVERLGEWEAIYRDKVEKLVGEVRVLERERDVLRAAIEAEAEAAGFELAEDEDREDKGAVAEA